MRSIVFLGLMALVCGVCCRDLRIENLPRQLRLSLKDKRGFGDRPLAFPSHGSSYSAPIYSSLGSGYSLGGSSGGFSLGQAGLHGLSGSVSHGIGYPVAPSNGLSLGSGYLSSSLGHGSLSNLQGVSLGGHSAQSSYPVPSIANIGAGGGNGLFTPSKTGPVTFGLHGGSGSTSASGSSTYSSPVYASGNHGLSAYSSGSLPVMLGSSHGGSSYSLPLSSSGSSAGYSLPAQSSSSSPSHTVTGGLIIASGPHGASSSYNQLSTSGASHGAAFSSSNAASHGASSSYSLPITSGAHGVSALANSPTSSYSTSSSGSYGAAGSHVGLSGGSSDSSSYELPISSGSYSSSGSSSSSPYTSYLPAHSDSSASYSSSSGSSYSSPSVTYAAPNSNYVSSNSDYSALGSSYSSPSSSYSGPSVSYAGSSNYAPTYASPSGSYGAPGAEPQGAYSGVNPRYLGYATAKAYESLDSERSKYDTISYSSPNGKY
ncbi:uncharacterized transmembrane protein DDB_G0289901-like [Harpegnathos saltator]|uniref:uncharacterized transmembrane protein DDB_G0289901-like n=1 Tax=Harpegnathos saltator TaxID=610380 RepID=UPI0005910AF3|nr:uncharacterized transmembrane protein DDB_G0289901-like [Harpegnathos saltator]